MQDSTIVEILNIITWPIVSIFALIVLYKPLLQKLPFLESLKIGILHAQFEKHVTHAKKELEKKDDTPKTEDIKNKTVKSAPNTKQYPTRLLTISPTAAVLQSWQHVIDASHKMLESHDIEISFSEDRPYKTIEIVFEKSKLLKQSDIKVYRELRTLRNKVAHAKNFEAHPDMAQQFVDISHLLMSNIQAQSNLST
jgi:hypothetical protein